tara:strand:+ start:1595 stop:2161 length:567 start_codon:yes stop_codon:yes gene_type:complete
VFSSNHNSNSLLLRLPGELRNKIYEYAFGGHEVKLQCGPWSDDEDLYCYTQDSTVSLWSDLLSRTTICRQIYGETRLLPYALNTFCIPTWGAAYADWVQKLDESQKSAIKYVSLEWLGTLGLCMLPSELNHVLQALDDCAGLSHITITVEELPSARAKIQAFANKRGIEVELERVKPVDYELDSDIED